jgi:hypothetical protein
VSTRWQVGVPLTAADGAYQLLGRATYQQETGAAADRDESSGWSATTLDKPLTTRLNPALVALDPGDSAHTQLQVTNHAAREIEVAWNQVQAPTADPGYTLAPASGTVRIPAGGTRYTTLTASASEQAGQTPTPLRLDLMAAAPGHSATRAGSQDLRIRSRLHPYLSDLDWTEATSEWDS